MQKSKIAALVLLALLVFSTFSTAKERRGTEVMVAKQDGTRVSGELIAVKKDSLLLLAGQPLAGIDLTVSLAEINEVKIIKKSRVGTGLGYGLLIGGSMGSLIGFASGDDPPGFMSFTASQKAALLGAVLGGMGIIVGTIGGGLSGIDESISFRTKSETELRSIQTRLAKFARLNDKIY